MSQFKACIQAQEAKKALSPEWRKLWEETYDAHYRGAEANFGAEAADKMAGQKAIEKVAAEIKRERYLIHLQKVKRKELLDGLIKSAQRDVKTPDAKFAAGLKKLMEHGGGETGAPFSSVQGRQTAISGQFHSMMADLIDKFEAGIDNNIVMKRNRALLENVVKEAFGENTGDGSAKYLYKAWYETAEYARQRFNMNGGDIGKLENWGLPQKHVGFLIKRADEVLGISPKEKGSPEKAKQAWIDYVKARIDPEKMVDSIANLPFGRRDANGALVSDERLDVALSKMYDRVVTEGSIDLPEGGVMGASKLANAYKEGRFLKFKDAQSFMEYQETFGGTDPFASMMQHLDQMSRDIAMIEVLGPNPKNNWDWLVREAQRRADLEVLDGKRGAKGRAQRMIGQAENMWGVFTGSNLSFDDENMTRQAFGNLNGYLTGIQLGSAILSDLPSGPVFGAFARSFTGLSKKGDMRRFFKLLFHEAKTDAYAKRAGFVNEAAREGLINQAYHNQLYFGSSIGERLPSLVFKLNGQTQFTGARKRSFGLEFMGALSEIKEKSLEDLKSNGDATDKLLAKTIENWGFKPDEWDLIRSAPDWEPEDGAKFLRMQDIETHLKETGIDEKRASDLATRYGEMIQMEALRAVPENSLYARAATSGFIKDGAGLWAEIVKSMAKYRGFSVTLSYYWGGEMHARMIKDGFSGVANAAGFFVALTMAGALSMQLREVKNGNTPRGDYDKPAFWQAAMLQGGGLGIVGDFFNQAKNRAGNSSALTALGPVGSFIGDTIAIPNDLMRQQFGIGFVDDEGKPNPKKKMINWGARYMPWSNVWYLKAAWDRGIIAHLRNAFDPNADKYWAAQKKAMNEKEQDYYWKPAGDLDLEYLANHIGGVDEPAP